MDKKKQPKRAERKPRTQQRRLKPVSAMTAKPRSSVPWISSPRGPIA